MDVDISTTPSAPASAQKDPMALFSFSARAATRLGRTFAVIAIGCATASALGCATAAEEQEAEASDSALGAGADVSLRFVVPELPAALASSQLSIEVTARAPDGFLGLGERFATTTAPIIVHDEHVYAPMKTSAIRIGRDRTVYIQFETTRYYGQSAGHVLDARYPWDSIERWRQPLKLGDYNQAGFYVIGKLIGVSDEDLRHGARLDTDNIELEPGMSFAFDRPNVDKIALITIESTSPPKFVESVPDLVTDEAAFAARQGNGQ